MTDRTDNFNRANTTNAIGTPSDGGSAWSQLSGTWGITGNTAYESAGSSQSICVLEASVPNVAVQAKMVSQTIGEMGLVARVADNNNYLLLVLPSGAVYRVTAGGFNLLGSTSSSFAPGDVAKMTIDSANLLTIFKNGVSVFSVTESQGATNTKHGMRSHSNVDVTLDDFSITNLDVIPLGFGKISLNRKYFLPSEAALVLAALESKRRLSRRRFFQWLPGAFWRK